MTDNEDPKVEMQTMRALLAARFADVREQARRYRNLAKDADDRATLLAARLVEIDAAITAINSQRGP
jgi:hypothetical protein